jgi:hypothetical protein
MTAFLDGDVLVLVALAAPLDVGENRIGPSARTGRFLVQWVSLVDDLDDGGRLVDNASHRLDLNELLARLDREPAHRPASGVCTIAGTVSAASGTVIVAAAAGATKTRSVGRIRTTSAAARLNNAGNCLFRAARVLRVVGQPKVLITHPGGTTPGVAAVRYLLLVVNYLSPSRCLRIEPSFPLE